MRREDGSWGHAYATHIALLIDRGITLSSGEYACHTCDNPQCVNPRHLFVSDQSGNMDDCARKGRAAPNTKRLSRADAETIIRRKAAGEGSRDLADEFGVSIATIQQIARGFTWKWLRRPEAAR
jgi:hypothetical protein